MPEPITGDMTINRVIELYPQTIGVFNRFNVDSCCGGSETLERAAARDGADLERLLEALRERATPVRGTGR